MAAWPDWPWVMRWGCLRNSLRLKKFLRSLGGWRISRKRRPTIPHNSGGGQVTDDTGLGLATAYAYSPDGYISIENMAQELVCWEDETQPDILGVIEGPSTRAAVAQLREGADPRQTGKNGKTNGAAMRMAAVGLMNAGDFEGVLEDAVEASLPTHGTSAALAGAVCVACAVAEAAHDGATLDSILQAARQGAERGGSMGSWCWSTSLVKRIELAEELVHRASDDRAALRALSDYVGTDMLVSESVASAMGVVRLSQGDPMRAIRYGANIGGDTDTIAAIAGQICGALQGIGAFDGRLLEQVERVNQIDLKEESHRLLKLKELRKDRRLDEPYGRD
jgi:ADP-ribosylglycohydrolase